MKRGYACLRRADGRIRLFCRRLTRRQRSLVAITAFLLFLAACLYIDCLRALRSGKERRDDENRTYPAARLAAGRQYPSIQTTATMKTDIQKIKKLLGLSGDEPLTPEEKRRRAKFVIYPLFS